MTFRIRSAIAAVTLAATLVVPTSAAVTGADAKVAKAISQHFTKTPTMTGEFMQFGPDGSQTGGKFYLQRPGKIRFDYAAPAGMTVKADGRTVGVNNHKLETWDFYPLSKTPLKLLLSDRIDVGDKAIKSVKQEADLTTVIMEDKSVFGNSKITLMFDPKTYDLRQWTITDEQGKDTSVMIFNVTENVKLSKRIFQMDKTKSRARRQGNDGR